MACESLKSDKLHLFLFSECTCIDDITRRKK